MHRMLHVSLVMVLLSSLVAADGKLFSLRSEKGVLRIIEASPNG
ncbi:MAG TPA: hypothetical protein VMZ92_18675 [Planctomycetota bacterium]|nr:hypothetical protein [Planctomycetota bacterium]